MAERVGLRPGDTILEVNGTPFSTISHEEALKVSYKNFFIFPLCTVQLPGMLSLGPQSAANIGLYQTPQMLMVSLLGCGFV